MLCYCYTRPSFWLQIDPRGLNLHQMTWETLFHHKGLMAWESERSKMKTNQFHFLLHFTGIKKMICLAQTLALDQELLLAHMEPFSNLFIHLPFVLRISKRKTWEKPFYIMKKSFLQAINQLRFHPLCRFEEDYFTFLNSFKEKTRIQVLSLTNASQKWRCFGWSTCWSSISTTRYLFAPLGSVKNC